MKRNKLIEIIILALFTVGILISSYLFFKGVNISDLTIIFGENKILISLFFLLLFSFRIFLFIPSTVLIIALGFLSNDFLLTFFISIVGVLIGLTEAYFIGYFIEGDIEKHRFYKKMEPYLLKFKKNGFKATLIGSFLPFLPTDIICYTAGFSQYNFKKFLLAGFLGELTLVLLYSYLGKEANLYIEKLNHILIYLILGLIFIYIINMVIKKLKKLK